MSSGAVIDPCIGWMAAGEDVQNQAFHRTPVPYPLTIIGEVPELF
jgi:hypothetical protein